MNETTENNSKKRILLTILLIVLIIIIIASFTGFIYLSKNQDKFLNSDDISTVESSGTESKSTTDGSNDLLTEQEVIDLLNQKGFDTEYTKITYKYLMDGETVDETNIEKGNIEKHPTYETTYRGTNITWTIYIVGKNIYASPTSYLIEKNISEEILVSESDIIVSYDNENNKFDSRKPDESEMKVITINEITKENLDNLNLN